MKFDTPAGTNPIDQLKVVGRPTDRIDGPCKTTGTAPYAYERHDVVPNQAYGFVVGAGIAKGRIAAMDVAEASNMPGVLAIVTAKNAGVSFSCTSERMCARPMRRSQNSFALGNGTSRRITADRHHPDQVCLFLLHLRGRANARWDVTEKVIRPAMAHPAGCDSENRAQTRRPAPYGPGCRCITAGKCVRRPGRSGGSDTGKSLPGSVAVLLVDCWRDSRGLRADDFAARVARPG